MTAPAPPLEAGSSIGTPSVERTIGLLGATRVGIGAIVGGGILVLAGVAFGTSGPAAMLAFALNGFIAVLTALSFAEMSTSFPQSGGAYTFAKKVLSVRAAFGVGWVLWFAYIVAGVLYAFGFAEYGLALIRDLAYGTGPRPEWVESRVTLIFVAIVPTVIYALGLIRKPTGGGDFSTWGKIVVFVVLIGFGAFAFGRAMGTGGHPLEPLTPFIPFGFGGLLQAMGLTFIALQGFDLIAAIAGEVKEPGRTIPRAMLLSLGAALCVYLPLLFVVSTVGTPDGTTIQEMSHQNPETVMADAVRNYMGPVGYWLVMVAAILSTLSALQANLLAASRIAQSMALDRTMPRFIGTLHGTHGTPAIAIYATTVTLVALLMALPDLAAAGSAASLIFLIAFALAHGTCILARLRAEERRSTVPGPRTPPLSVLTGGIYRTPYFPLVPLVGGASCLALAAFQGVAEPAAGALTLMWLAIGGLLYAGLFSERAEAFDAFAEAHDPELARMRGRNPLVVVPVANPASAEAMVEVAAAVAPPHTGRVMLLRVIDGHEGGQDPKTLENLHAAQLVLTQALTACWTAGHRPEALVTLADDPWREILRVIRNHRCEGLILGLGDTRRLHDSPQERLLASADCDLTFIHAPQGWRPSEAHRVLVPVSPGGQNFELRARFLGSLQRSAPRHVTWLMALPDEASPQEVTGAQRFLRRLAEDNALGDSSFEVLCGVDPLDAVVDFAKDADLVLLGLQRGKKGSQQRFGDFVAAVARRVGCATVLIGSRPG